MKKYEGTVTLSFTVIANSEEYVKEFLEDCLEDGLFEIKDYEIDSEENFHWDDADRINDERRINAL